MKLFAWLSPVRFNKYASTYVFSPKAKIITIWIMIAAFVMFLLSVAHLLPVFIWAAVAAYLFNPVVSMVSERSRLPKSLCIIILYLVVGCIIYWGVRSLMPVVAYEFRELSVGQSVQSGSLLGRIAAKGDINILGGNIDLKEAADSVAPWLMAQFPSKAFPLFFGAVERLVLLLVFFVVAFYFLMESGKYLEALEKVIPEPYREEIASLIERVNMTLGSYIRAQVLLIFIMSTASFIVLSILKIKFAAILSIMTGVFEVIPVIGPVCATAIVAMVALFQTAVPYGLTKEALVLLVIILYFVLRQLEDYLIIPNVAAHFVRVNPVIGIFALLVGGAYAGILGLFLAVPTAAILKVIIGYIYQKLTE
ncbi:MAG: AI-2E family transporter [Candidatus Saganbacteria bacterium]|nr:AI-2E family transporter [Candidatus Saganbacteria bacterium]